MESLMKYEYTDWDKIPNKRERGIDRDLFTAVEYHIDDLDFAEVEKVLAVVGAAAPNEGG